MLTLPRFGVGDDGSRRRATLSVQLCLPFVRAISLNEADTDACIVALPPDPENPNSERGMESPSITERLDLLG